MPDPEKGRGLAAELMMEHLLKVLLAKGVLDLTDVRSVLEGAMREAGTHAQTEAGYGALQFIPAMLSGPFSARPK